MKEYTVIWGCADKFKDAEEALSRQVKEAFEQGWKLQGGVGIAIDGDGAICMFQALVR